VGSTPDALHAAIPETPASGAALRPLFVSPHPDDICFSVACLAAHVAGPKHLLTVFTCSRWTEPGRMPGAGHAEVTAARKREDVSFCRRNAFTRHALAMPDSSMRHEPGRGLRDSTGHEAALAESILTALRALCRRERTSALFAPLALGVHADHVACRVACEQVAAEGGLALLYYEDLPYAGELTMSAIRRAATGAGRLRPWLCRSAVPLEEKLAAVSAYETQSTEVLLGSIAGHARRLARRVRGAEGAGVERLWLPAGERVPDGLFDERLEVRPERSWLAALLAPA
jgi:LmbE family N-acetylglucosaminyl deacetylase